MLKTFQPMTLTKKIMYTVVSWPWNICTWGWRSSTSFI